MAFSNVFHFYFRFAGYFQSKPGSLGGSGGMVPHYNQRTQSGDSQGSDYRSSALKLADFARNNQEISTNGEIIFYDDVNNYHHG